MYVTRHKTGGQIEVYLNQCLIVEGFYFIVEKCYKFIYSRK